MPVNEETAYELVLDALDRAAIDPSEWETVCYRIAELVGATGSAMLPGTKAARAFPMPLTESLERSKEYYVDNEIYLNDARDLGVPKMRRTGFMTDFDVMTLELQEKNPYYQEFIIPHGLRWFVGMGFSVESGRGFGLFTIQRPEGGGPFLDEEIERLRRVKPAVQKAVQQAELLGWQRIDATRSLLEPAGMNFFAIGWNRVPAPISDAAAQAAESAGLVVQGHLSHKSPAVDRFLQTAINVAVDSRPGVQRVCSPPIRMLGTDGSGWIAEIIPTPRDFPSLTTNAAALLTLRRAQSPGDPVEAFAKSHGLSAREATLLAHLVEGRSVREASERMSIGYETARSYLRAIFAKTGTHRQAELLTLATRGH